MSEETRPSERAMKAAIVMEIHAACSTLTRAKASALDELFPAHDAMLSALKLAKDHLEEYIESGLSTCATANALTDINKAIALAERQP